MEGYAALNIRRRTTSQKYLYLSTWSNISIQKRDYDNR